MSAAKRKKLSPAPIGRVLRNELESFLAQHGDTWEIDAGPAFMEHVPHLPLTTRDFGDCLAAYRPDIDYVYLLWPSAELEQAIDELNWDAVPQVSSADLPNYIVRNVKGKDFLWLFPSDEDLSNMQYLTLLPSTLFTEEVEEKLQQPKSAPRSGLTAIEIENFKGIGKRQRIELKPLTLLFGANSAGKSTLLHTLHYAREIFERHNLDADQTIGGGPFVDLGGFENFVHGHDRSRTVMLRFEMDLSNADIPSYVVASRHAPSVESDAMNISAAVTSGAVEIHISASDARKSLFISRYSVDINGAHLATIECHYGRRTVALTELNTRHPLFIPGFAAGSGDDTDTESILDYLFRTVTGNEFDAEQQISFIQEQPDAIPVWGQLLQLAIPRQSPPPRQGKLFEGLDDPQREFRFDEGDFEHSMLYALLTQAIAGPGEVLRNLLRDFRYLGPLRETPPREYAPPRFPDSGRWASGLSAWDVLHTGSDSFVEEVSDWLADAELLNAGYELIRRNVIEVDTASLLFLNLVTGRGLDEDEPQRIDPDTLSRSERLVLRPVGSELELRPHDIGIGISQVVPVVVTALEGRDKLIAIEQPELHLHPKLQAELGDLFIASALGDRKHNFLLETHSEVIPLRVMRRIRNSQDGQLPPHCPSIGNDDVAVYYVSIIDGTSRFQRLELADDGSMLDPWPGGFFEEGFRERFDDGDRSQ